MSSTHLAHFLNLFLVFGAVNASCRATENCYSTAPKTTTNLTSANMLRIQPRAALRLQEFGKVVSRASSCHKIIAYFLMILFIPNSCSY